MMKRIKLIYCDVDNINLLLLHQKLERLCSSIYQIQKELILVTYNGTSKDLYDKLEEILKTKQTLILDIDASDGSYWGYMKKDLWQWFESNTNASER